VNQSAGINYGKENFDLAVSGAFVYNLVAYNVDKGSNTKYFNQAYSADFTYRSKTGFYFLLILISISIRDGVPVLTRMFFYGIYLLQGNFFNLMPVRSSLQFMIS
jgi:hypothetical protein